MINVPEGGPRFMQFVSRVRNVKKFMLPVVFFAMLKSPL